MTENELVAIDLTSIGWPLHRVPYLLGVNAWSPVTCVQHASSVSDAVWNNILAAGNAEVGCWSSKVCLMSNMLGNVSMMMSYYAVWSVVKVWKCLRIVIIIMPLSHKSNIILLVSVCGLVVLYKGILQSGVNWTTDWKQYELSMYLPGTYTQLWNWAVTTVVLC